MFKTIDEFIRVLHGSVEYGYRVDLPHAWMPLYGEEGSFALPRHKLADCMPRNEALLAELWALGMEAVFDEEGKEVYLIAAEHEGGGLSLRENEASYMYTGYDAAATVRWFEVALASGTHAKTFTWDNTYLLRAASLHSVEVKLLDLPYPERVYTCNVYEGEGWWAQMVFAVR